MKNTNEKAARLLQLFAEGAAGAEAATGETVADAAPQEIPGDPDGEFEKLIKGKYKQAYDARVQQTISRRLRGTKQTQQAYDALQPVITELARQHGVDPADHEALVRALRGEEDHPGLADNAARLCESWLAGERQLKACYPDFDLAQQLQNGQFRRLLRAGADLRSAYEVANRDRVIPAAMAFAAAETGSRIARRMATLGSRPVENGMLESSALSGRPDVSKLSRSQMDDVARRVARGERVSFG